MFSAKKILFSYSDCGGGCTYVWAEVGGSPAEWYLSDDRCGVLCTCYPPSEPGTELNTVNSYVEVPCVQPLL